MIISPKARVEISRSLDSWTIISALSAIVSSCVIDTGRFSQAFSSPVKNFLTIESFAAAVFLDHHVRDFVDAFVTGESALASQTLPAPPNRVAFLAFPRIHDFVLKVAAKRTFHSVSDWGFRMVLRISLIVRPSFSIHGIVVARFGRLLVRNPIMAADKPLPLEPGKILSCKMQMQPENLRRYPESEPRTQLPHRPLPESSRQRAM